MGFISVMTYYEFDETLTSQQRADWEYEGITVRELYDEYLALMQEPDTNSCPEWAY
jgi:hypothetical protein